MSSLLARASLVPALALVVTWMGGTTGCELAVDLNPQIDGSVSDVLDCGICADVSADANYDGPEVSIYGNPPGDAGVASDAAMVGDATLNAHD